MYRIPEITDFPTWYPVLANLNISPPPPKKKKKNYAVSHSYLSCIPKTPNRASIVRAQGASYDG